MSFGKLESLDPKLRERIKSQLAQKDPYAHRTNAQAEVAGQPVCESVVEMVPAEPQHREIQTLASRPRQRSGRKARRAAIHCLIIRLGKKLLDDDNLATSYKATRDEIAKQLGIDDGSELIEWQYDQVPTRGATGTHITITTKGHDDNDRGTKAAN